MATDFDWRLDSPWRRLPWTLPGAVSLLLAGLWTGAALLSDAEPSPDKPPPIDVRLVELPPPPPVPEIVLKTRRKPPPVNDAAEPAPAPQKPPAALAAPPAPSAEEWQLASTYTLKNSKRYRHHWGQLVRSQMGTAVEGPDQGQVRFRIEIAPDGKIAKVEELWSTSAKASELAWQAIRTLPPTPPTPTGKPLIFEQTIAFLPYETGWPPSYTLDCLPDPPAFKNPYAWVGGVPPAAPPAPTPSPPGEPVAAPECVIDSTAATIEEEERELKRQMEANRWGS
ncbi:MAG: energy transducer TonB [Pseudomonadota bacterium]